MFVISLLTAATVPRDSENCYIKISADSLGRCSATSKDSTKSKLLSSLTGKLRSKAKNSFGEICNCALSTYSPSIPRQF